MSRLGKMERLAMSYGMGASTLGTMIHDDMLRQEPRPAKGKKPWQKGFIPTVGKKPKLPAPVLGGEWQFRERTGNVVEYWLRSEDPFSWALPRIKGDLVKKQWTVVVTKKDHQVHDASWYQEQTLFTSSNHQACVVFVALDPELTAQKVGIDWGAPMFKTHTGRFSAMAPAFQSLSKLAQRNNSNHQLEYYRGLMTEYCNQDLVLFTPKVIAELDKADDETV